MEGLWCNPREPSTAESRSVVWGKESTRHCDPLWTRLLLGSRAHWMVAIPETYWNTGHWLRLQLQRESRHWSWSDKKVSAFYSRAYCFTRRWAYYTPVGRGILLLGRNEKVSWTNFRLVGIVCPLPLHRKSDFSLVCKGILNPKGASLF